jgi:hypothetical protein
MRNQARRLAFRRLVADRGYFKIEDSHIIEAPIDLIDIPA